jgi:Fe-S oxidoreductase
MEAIKAAIKTSKAYLCYECGKCTSKCPIAQFAPEYSPRRTVGRVLRGEEQDLMQNGQLWSCLTCAKCNVYCPSDVDYVGFMKEMRTVAHECGLQGWCSHGGALHSMMKVMTSPDLTQNRLDWVTADMRIAEEGEYLYFVGCLPYFDVFFAEFGVKSLETAKSTVRILNALGIEPVLMKNERCCGHDLLWEGDVENFMKLAELNLAEMKKSGVKKIITNCSECTRTLRKDYPERFGKLDFEVLHLSELLAEKISDGGLELKPNEKVVTYQDPCRLGRHLGTYDAPRSVMASIPGVELREMSKNRKNSVCCGTSAWTNCDRHSKQIQIDRLKSARSTGADVLVTTCPKCEIHFRCALSGNGVVEDEARIEIEDLAVLVAEAL